MHSDIQELVPLLAVGGLETEEISRLEQHLATCSACRALLAEYAFVAEELSAQVPPMTLAPGGEAKLATQLELQPARAVSPEVKTHAHATGGFWRQPVRLTRFAVGAAVVIGLVLLGAAAVFFAQMQTLRAAEAQSASRAQTVEKLKIVPLTAAASGPDGYLCLAPDNPTAMLWLTKMAALDEDHTYQLWLNQNGTRTNGGTFRPGSDGRAIVFVNAPEPWSKYQEVGVTIEPVGGSPKPTTPRVIGGKLY